MAKRMQRWVDEKHRMIQQFSHDELHAEMLRQQIQELETQEFDSVNFQKLEILKLELAAFQMRADVTFKGRIQSNKIIELMKELRMSRAPPPNAEKTLKEYLAWLEVMEDSRKQDYSNHRTHIMQELPNGSWEYRGNLLRWFGKEIYHRIARQKIPYYISRVTMSYVLKMVKKG